MEQIFREIVSMSITAGYCILVVLFLRLLMRKLPKIYSYLLWSVVGFRLVSPFSIKSAFSLVRMVPQDVTEQLVNLEQSPIPTINETSEIPVLSDEIKNQSDMALQNYGQTLPQNVWQGESISAYGRSFSMNPLQFILEVAVVVWIVGVIALLIYSVWTMLRLKKKLRAATYVEGNIYEVKNLPTPFVFGIFQPRIYLPEELRGEDRKFVLLHEQTHIRRKDYLIKQISYFIVCVHWFNPLVWLAYNFMCQDMEMSCDESVIRCLGKEQKARYSATLLSLASGKKIALGSPLAFGEGGIKKRIVNVLNYKRPAFWVSVGLIIVLAIILLGLSLNPREKADLDSEIGEQGQEQTVVEEEIQIDINEASIDPDDFSQAVHYTGYLDESPYTHWNTGWNNCDFDGDGIRDRVYREVNEQEGEITYRIEFGNGEMLEVARTGDYFMWPKIKGANICGDENKEILFVGKHSLATSPDADVALFEKTKNGYEEIPLLHPIEWFGNVDGAVYLYANDEPILDMMGPTADFVEQFDWNSWCESEAWEQLHFGTYEETGRTAVDADFINYEGSPCLILYHNIGDKWLYKEIGFVFRVGESKESGTEREMVLEKIVADGLQYGEIYSSMSWLGEPELIIPVEDENVIANKGYYVELKYKGLEVTMNTSDNFQLLPSSSVHSITITGNDLLALGSFQVGTSKSEIMQEYQLNEGAFLPRSQNFPEGEDGVEVYRIENDGIRECSVPEYDTFCVIKEPDNPVALIYLLKEETVNTVLVRHLTAD